MDTSYVLKNIFYVSKKLMKSVMKLIRLVIATISPPIDLDINAKIGAVEVKTLFVLNLVEKKGEEEIEEEKREEMGEEIEEIIKSMYFLYGNLNIPEELSINPDNLIIIPNEIRKEIEEAIEAVVNFSVISTRSTRTITSSIPHIFIEYESEDEKKILDQTNGFFLQFGKIPSVTPKIDYDNSTLELLQDRLDGIALLAEALSHSHPTGRFHELVRLFERAFHRTGSRLVEPLAEFLSGARNQGYTEPEIRNWVVEVRNPAIHGVREDELVLEAGIRPIVDRMEQAVYDVLFNKVNWRDTTPTRRDIWSPVSGTSSDNLDLFHIKGTETSFTFQLLDGFSSYPVSLLDFSSILLNKIPENWWYEKKESFGLSGEYKLLDPD